MITRDKNGSNDLFEFGGQRSIQLSYARLTLFSNSERLLCTKEAGGYYALGKRDRKQIRWNTPLRPNAWP